VTAGRVALNGVSTHYEMVGIGPPLLLLHGGFQIVDRLIGLAEELSARFTVYLPQRRGHGRTPDVEGPVSYQLMTEDTSAFLDAFGIERAEIVGYSDGGNIGLLLAIQAPDRVARLVCISANTSPLAVDLAGFLAVPEHQATLESMRVEYDRLSPDGPQHRPVIREKLMRMWTEEPQIGVDDLARVVSPTLVMAADRDVVPVDHTVALWRAIPHAELCVVPGTSHLLIEEKPDLVHRVVLDFLR
jgi:pimeloyl-ACP methyl ester carboxylesterase